MTITHHGRSRVATTETELRTILATFARADRRDRWYRIGVRVWTWVESATVWVLIWALLVFIGWALLTPF